VSGDTCWNVSPNNDKHETVDNKNIVSDYNPPTRERVLLVRDSPYTFKLKAGERLNYWISFGQVKNIHLTFSSSNYDYWIIYSESEKYHGGEDTYIPDRVYSRFYFEAGNTDQVITMHTSFLSGH